MKFNCACGHVIVDGTEGLPNKAHVLPDQSRERVWDEIDAAIEEGGSGIEARAAICMRVRSILNRAMRTAWQCAQCGRLYVDDASHRPQVFAPESPEGARGILGRGRPRA